MSKSYMVIPDDKGISAAVPVDSDGNVDHLEVARIMGIALTKEEAVGKARLKTHYNEPCICWTTFMCKKELDKLYTNASPEEQTLVYKYLQHEAE